MKLMRRSSWFAVFLVALSLVACASGPSEAMRTELPTRSDQTDNQKRAAIRMQLAVGYYQQHQMDVALDEIKQALLVDPDLSDAYGVRALIYMDMGEMRLAEDNFQRAIKLAPNNPDFKNNFAWLLCQSGREGQSIAYFEEALKNRTYRSPEKALNNAGVCSLKLKNIALAERYFSESFKYDPANPSTNANLAKIHYDRHDYERAHFYIDRVVKADVLAADVLWLAIKIERKRGDRAAEIGLVTQLHRRHASSSEYAAYQRGAFDE